MIANSVYLLCAATSVWCMHLLIQGYRRNPTTLLFWSIVSFTGLALNNLLLVADYILFPTGIDLAIPRAITGFAAVAALTFGLVSETT